MIFESLQEIKSDSYETSKEIVGLLKQKEIIDHLVNQFKQRSIQATWEANQTTVRVYARTAEDLTSAVAILKSSLLDTKREVSEERTQVVQSEGFKNLVKGIEQDYPGEMKLMLNPDARLLISSLIFYTQAYYNVCYIFPVSSG